MSQEIGHYEVKCVSPRRNIYRRSTRTTYAMKQELYTKNENSSHKNDDFCIKTPKAPPK